MTDVMDVTTVAAEVNRQIDEYERLVENDNLMLRSTVSTIMKYLLSTGHCYQQCYPWWMVGVDPSNRYGDGLDPERVHKLIHAIYNSGWASEEVENAVAREIGPDETSCVKMNVDLGLESNEMLALLKPENLKVVTLSCGHTNAGLGCIGGAAKCFMAELDAITHEGRFSLAKLRERKPQHADAVDNGIRFKVIRYDVIKLCPRLASYVQEAYNMGHSVAQQESCFQVVRKIYVEAAKYQKAKKPVQWTNIKNRVAATRPMHAIHVDGYAAFVQKHVDADGVMLQRLGAYLKRVPAKAAIKGALFKALSEVNGTPEYIEAIIMAMYHPGKAAFVKAGWSSLIASPDILKLDSSLAPRVAQATKLMVDARQALEKVSPHDACNLLGNFGRELVMFVHGKSKEFNTMLEVAQDFWKGVLSTHKANVAANPPKSFGKATKTVADTTPSGSSSQSNMRAVNENGVVDTMCELARRGFVVGSTVLETVVSEEESSEARMPTTIVAIQKSRVLLGDEKHLSHSVFLHAYSLKKAVGEVTVMNVGDAVTSKAWMEALYEAKAKFLLSRAWVAAGANMHKDVVEVHDKPIRKLVLKVDIKRQELKLVPLSTAVRFTAKASKVASHQVLFAELGFTDKDGTVNVCVIDAKPAVDATCCVPFFAQRPSKDMGGANLGASTIEVQWDGATYNVPILTNKVGLPRGTELRSYAAGPMYIKPRETDAPAPKAEPSNKRKR
jgi:hypothetical protein